MNEKRNRVECDCGNSNAQWRGLVGGRREYRCDDCVKEAEALNRKYDPATGMTASETAALHRQGICPMD